MNCDFQPTGEAAARCIACGFEVPAWKPGRVVYRRCPIRSIPAAEVSADWAEKCRTCPEYILKDGILRMCRRDVYHPDAARPCESRGVAAFSARLLGQQPPCPRWLGPEPRRKIGGAYITLIEATRDCLALAAELPPDLDAVVGVARSGMPWASMIAILRHLPLYAVSSRTGRVNPCGHGLRLNEAGAHRRILLIDDTIYGGGTWGKVLPAVKKAMPGVSIVSAVLYATPEHSADVNHFAAIAPGHLLEWNCFNNPGLAAGMALDWDGILNPDWTGASDDEGPAYQEFLRRTPALQTPRSTIIPAIISGRLEKFRPLCEAWLTKNRIKTRRLILWPGNAPDRWKNDACARWKAEEFRRIPEATLYVESDPRQAQIIATSQRKRVLCPALGRVL